MIIKIIVKIVFCCALILCASPLENIFSLNSANLQAASFTEQQDSLRKLQKRINNLQKQIRKDTRLRDESQSLLETIDLDIAKSRTQLEKNQSEIKKSNFRISALADEEAAALDKMGEQQKQLAALLKLAHQNQQTPALKLLLNEKNPAKLSRQMVYYRHIMQAQEGQISSITQQVRGFVSLLDAAKKEKTQLEILQSKNQQDLNSLEQTRSQRKILVTQLAANIKTQTAEVNTLDAQEKALNKIIAELTRTLETFPEISQINFKALRGKLNWPVKGKLLHRYGQNRISGQNIKWKGVFVEAKRDTPVRAVAYGRVVYADWLPGLGLLTILEHGNNYMSLYANTEFLYKDVGAWVQAGEVIATTGDSGGNKNTGLYFEIRRGKSSLNPSPWFATSKP